MGYMKGQGATEYLVLLAVVLIIALVSIALLGFFPGMASDAKITQSASYWRGEARPFAILEHKIGAGSGAAQIATLVIQNTEASGTMTLTQLNVGACQNGSLTVSLAPGETKTVGCFAATAPVPGTTTSGSIYDVPVSFIYSTPGGLTAQNQTGAKNIMGKFV